MSNESGAWVDEEFDSLDLGDPRRDRRAKELLKRFAALPTASIPGACDDWSQTIGAYRLLGNEQIDWRDVMQPHWERTAERVGQFPVVLCIADTTELNFNGQFATRREAMDAVLDRIAFYNHRRLHATLGYLSPMQYEQRWHATQRKKVA